MNYCQTCNGSKTVAQLLMPWDRFIDIAIPVRIGANSHDISAQELLKKVKQLPCPDCSVPKVMLIAEKIAETVETKKDSNEDNRKDG